MNIPSEAKQKWDSLHEHGDITKIMDDSGLSRDPITAALKGDECTEDVFTAIQTFYNKRQEAINNLMNPQENSQA